MMKLMKTGSIISTLSLLAIVWIGAASAQDSVIEAKAYFFQAEAAFEEDQHEDVLKYLQKAEELSGETGAKILSLKVRSLFELGRIDEASEALTEYHASVPSEASLKEIAPILIKVTEAKTALTEAKNKADFINRQPFEDYSLLKQSGSNGRRGERGADGSNSYGEPPTGKQGKAGGSGKQGKEGSRGADGGSMVLTIREVPTDYTSPIALVSVLSSSDISKTLGSGFFDFDQELSIDVSGGDGGSGGPGGRGGEGGPGASGRPNPWTGVMIPASRAGTGGTGGEGGDGARGGNGGTIEVTLVGSEAFAEQVKINLLTDVSGGEGGDGGLPGRGGQGGSSYRPGASGNRGGHGRFADDGRKGSIRFSHFTAEEFDALGDSAEETEQ